MVELFLDVQPFRATSCASKASWTDASSRGPRTGDVGVVAALLEPFSAPCPVSLTHNCVDREKLRFSGWRGCFVERGHEVALEVAQGLVHPILVLKAVGFHYLATVTRRAKNNI